MKFVSLPLGAILISLTFNVAIADNIEFEIGGSTSQSSFNFEGSANSIVKWRDLNALNLDLGLKFYISPNSKLMLGFTYGDILSGEVSDDDIQNYTIINSEYNCNGNPNCGIYSVTKNLTGNDYKLGLFYGGRVVSSGVNNLWLLGGLMTKHLEIDPSGAIQITALPGNDNVHNISSSPLQVLKTDITGLGIGFEYERVMPQNTFGAGFTLFVPTNVSVGFYDWGGFIGLYDKFSQGGINGNSIGFDFKLSNSIKYTEKVWIKYYTFFDYLKLSDVPQTRYDVNGNVVLKSEAQQFIYYKFGVGMNLQLHL